MSLDDARAGDSTARPAATTAPAAEMRDGSAAPTADGDFIARPAQPPGLAGSGGDGSPGEPTGFGRGEPPAYRRPPGIPQQRSTYLDYLPGLYHGNEFLGRFLLIFEHILGPIDRTVENVPHLFDPDITPPELLPWLASWLGLVLDERWPEGRRRDLVRAAPRLYRRRGTRPGLIEFIRLATGLEAEIVEPTISEVAMRRELAYRFTVRVKAPPGETPDLELLRRIIDAEKPAFAHATLEVVAEWGRTGGTPVRRRRESRP